MGAAEVQWLSGVNIVYVKDHDVLDQHSSCKYGREEMETIWEAKIVELLLKYIE